MRDDGEEEGYKVSVVCRLRMRGGEGGAARAGVAEKESVKCGSITGRSCPDAFARVAIS